MSPELEQAVRERVILGHSKDQIAQELQEAGYDNESIEAIYAAVTSNTTVAATSALSLPRKRDLIKAAWGFMSSRLDLVVWLAVPSIAIAVFDYLFTTTTVADSLPLLGLLSVGTFALVVLAVMIQVAVIHTTIKHAAGTPVVFTESLAWARSHFFGWLWLVVLSGLVLFGGFMLFIVPGIIASVYIAFSQYVFVGEGLTGMAALQRSRQLVYGKFSSVLWSLFVMMLFIILLYIPVAIVAEILVPAVPGSMEGLIAGLLEGAVSGIAGVLAAYYLTALYRALHDMTPMVVAPTIWYKVYAGVGAVFFVLLFGLVMLFATVADEFGLGAEIDQTPTRFELEQAVIDADLQAELEAFQQQFQAELEAMN